MSRKQAIGFLAGGIVLLGAVFFFLAVFTDPLVVMLAVLFCALALALLLRKCPGFFQALRRPRGEDPYAPLPDVGERRDGARFTPRVILVSMDGAAGQIVIDKPEFRLGRDRSCDYAFPPPCPEISRVHFIIRYDPQRQESSIIDNHSQNGTFVNRNRLSPGAAQKLANGDMIQVGTLRFVAQSAHY